MKAKFCTVKRMERAKENGQLHDYIRVTRPGTALMLAGIALVIAGLIAFGAFGRLDTTLSAGAMAREGRLLCYIKEADAAQVAVGMPVTAGGAAYTVGAIAGDPIRVDGHFPAYLCHVGGLMEGEWVYEAVLEGESAQEGRIFTANIVIERIAPLTFILN